MTQVRIITGKYQAVDGVKYIFNEVATLEEVEAQRAIECNVAVQVEQGNITPAPAQVGKPGRKPAEQKE